MKFVNMLLTKATEIKKKYVTGNANVDSLLYYTFILSINVSFCIIIFKNTYLKNIFKKKGLYFRNKYLIGSSVALSRDTLYGHCKYKIIEYKWPAFSILKEII